MDIRIGFYSVILFICSFNCFARNYAYEGDCKSNRDYYALSDCIEKELQIYDSKLNEVYHYYSSKNRDGKLKQAERLWIKFKNADCNFWASEVMDGKVGEPIYYACLVNQTKKRIVNLQEPLSYGKCSFKKNSKGLLDCLKKELNLYNKELEDVCKPTQDKKLMVAEDAWVTFKEADCLYMAGKSSSPKEFDIVYYSCLINRTVARIKELNTSFFSVDWFQTGSEK